VRITITEPCVIECDGPILIEPIRERQAVIMAGLYTFHEGEHVPEATMPVDPPVDLGPEPEQPKTRADLAHDQNGKAIPRRRHGKPHLLTCLYCGIPFRGRRNQMYCTEAHKTAAYRKVRSAK
jgi:hypothetical protein